MGNRDPQWRDDPLGCVLLGTVLAAGLVLWIRDAGIQMGWWL